MVDALVYMDIYVRTVPCPHRSRCNTAAYVHIGVRVSAIVLFLPDRAMRRPQVVGAGNMYCPPRSFFI